MAGIGAQAVRLGRDLGVGWVRHVHRLRLTVEGDMPSEPVLFVANHGFGGALDLNVFATLAAIDSLQRDRPLVMLTHHLAWIVRVGPLLEPLGARLASREHAMTALADGCDVLVFPGGDLEAAKVWSQRHQVQFHGRKGFAEVAIEAGVPVVPIVTRGAGNTVLVLSDGRRLARLLRLDRLARTKALPINIAAPYGLNPGVAGLLPYLPFPARLATRVLPARLPEGSPEAFAASIEASMQDAMDALGAPDLTRAAPRCAANGGRTSPGAGTRS